MSQTTLDQLAEALETTRGKTPLEVIEAFCPAEVKIGPFSLVSLTAGHDLFLAQVRHPLASGNQAVWTPQDVAIALFAFTRPSRDLFRMVEDGTLEDALHAFLDDIPLGGIENAAAALISHWIKARAAALPMVSPYPAATSKKKAASVGGLP